MDQLNWFNMASNIPVNAHKPQNVIEVLLEALKSKQDEIKRLKTQLGQQTMTRNNSDDLKQDQSVTLTSQSKTENKTCADNQKNSSPNVFRFPNPKTESSTCDRTDNKSPDSTNDTDMEAVWNLMDRSKEPKLIPEQIFKNVINELIKTKTLLHNLQKCQTDNTAVMVEEMKNELQILKSKNEKLEIEIKKSHTEKQTHTDQIGPLKELSGEGEDVNQIQTGESTEHASLSTSVTLKAELDELKLLHKTLKHENEQKVSENQDLMKKNKAVQKDLAALKENIKMLTTCLQEEKTRSSQALTSLGSLRQQHEQLRIEKQALEKERSLESRPSKKYTPYTGSRRVSSETRPSGEVLGTSTTGGSSFPGSFNIKPDARKPVTQNNLSPQPFEKKPSNLPPSAPCIEQCPRCLVEFINDDEAYRKHLHKCMNFD